MARNKMVNGLQGEGHVAEGECGPHEAQPTADLHADVAYKTPPSNGMRDQVSSIDSAKLVKIQPAAHRGQAEMVPLLHQKANQPNKPDILYFSYQRDKFIYERPSNSFSRLAYPCDDASRTIADYHGQSGLDNPEILEEHKWEYGKNHFDIPIPTFRELFGEHAVAPFFVFQLFTVGLWCLDEYWYYSIFTLFMLVVFECTVVFQVDSRPPKDPLLSYSCRLTSDTLPAHTAPKDA